MGIFDRMGKVISSNVNAMLDKAEDDKKLIELNVEEMGEQVKAARQEVVAAVAAEKQLRKKTEGLQEDSERWDKRAELALKSGDEALAREALKHKRRLLGEIEAAEKARVEARGTALSMKAELERMERKLEDVKLRKSTLAARAQQARSADGTTGLGAKGGSSAFDNFRRMEEQIEGRAAQGSAMAEVEEALRDGGMSRAELDAKFLELERGGGASAADAAVEDDLAALKKRIRV